MSEPTQQTRQAGPPDQGRPQEQKQPPAAAKPPAGFALDTVESVKVARDQRRAELAEIDFDTDRPFRLKNGKQILDVAQLMAQSDFMVKDIFRGNVGACVGFVMLMGQYGINPIAASWKAYKASKDSNADSPIAFESQLIVSMLNAGNVLEDGFTYEFEGDAATRQVTVWGTLRGGKPKPLTTPQIGTIKVKNSPLWASDPDQQLCYYGARAWTRRYAPELLLGVIDLDEVQDMPKRGPDHARDITPRRGGAIYHEAPEQVGPTDDGEIGEVIENQGEREE